MWRGKIKIKNSYNGITGVFFFTYFWLFSKQQFPHKSLPQPGPNSSRSSLVQARSSWSTYFRLFPAITLMVWGVSKITFVFGEFIDNAERRGESLAGHGEGVVDHVKWGVDGWEAAEAVHVREHTVHIIDRHLWKDTSSTNKNVAWRLMTSGNNETSTWHNTGYYYWKSRWEHDGMMSR